MSERGEKIVCLAQELLRNERQSPAANVLPSEPHKHALIKAAYLAAFLSATGASLSSHAIQEIQRPINHYERVEIDALVFYAARESGEKETSLRQEIEKVLALPTLKELTAMDYRRVRHYLWNRIDRHKQTPRAAKRLN